MALKAHEAGCTSAGRILGRCYREYYWNPKLSVPGVASNVEKARQFLAPGFARRDPFYAFEMSFLPGVSNESPEAKFAEPSLRELANKGNVIAQYECAMCHHPGHLRGVPNPEATEANVAVCEKYATLAANQVLALALFCPFLALTVSLGR